jgi:hypothetical protein
MGDTMRVETITFEVSYKVFDVGEKVRPSSNRCTLEPGVYTVTSCVTPSFPGDYTIVFVEGHRTGVSAEYLVPADGL